MEWHMDMEYIAYAPATVYITVLPSQTCYFTGDLVAKAMAKKVLGREQSQSNVSWTPLCFLVFVVIILPISWYLYSIWPIHRDKSGIEVPLPLDCGDDCSFKWQIEIQMSSRGASKPPQPTSSRTNMITMNKPKRKSQAKDGLFVALCADSVGQINGSFALLLSSFVGD